MRGSRAGAPLRQIGRWKIDQAVLRHFCLFFIVLLFRKLAVVSRPLHHILLHVGFVFSRKKVS